MSYYAYDADGYVGDFASGLGWYDFAAWARRQGGALAVLGSTGMTKDLPSLRKQVVGLKADNDDDQSVLDGLKTLAEKAKECLIVSDGEVSE